MWGRWPPRGVSGPPPPRPRERGDQRPPPDSPDASKHPEEARNSRMVPAKAAHWGKDWVKNPLQAVPKSSRAGNRPASGCASTPRSAGHRARNGKGRTRGRSTGNLPRYLWNRSRIGRQTGKNRFTEFATPGREPPNEWPTTRLPSSGRSAHRQEVHRQGGRRLRQRASSWMSSPFSRALAERAFLPPGCRLHIRIRRSAF